MKTEEKLNYEEEGQDDLPEEDNEGFLLRGELKQVTEVLHDAQDQILRLKAEMDNQKKRLERKIDKARDFASTSFIRSILPVKDSMEKGLDLAYMEDGNIDASTLMEGMTSTLKILNDAFKKADVQELDPIGEVFNPDIHEAMVFKKTDDKGPPKILEVYQKGYTVKGQLIRPARVEVSGA